MIRKRILLTGGSGFIGKNIYLKLKSKYQIFKPTHCQLDMTDYLAVEQYIHKHNIQIVIHTAIKSGSDVLENTLRMFLGITRCLHALEKVIHFGSGAEYAKNHHLVKVKEQNLGLFIPLDDYGLAKYICSQIAKNQKKIITLRLFGIYGPYENYTHKFISNSIVKNLLHLPIKIKQNVIFDYLYIEDLIPIVDYFLTHNSQYTDFNVTPTQSIDLVKIVNIINRQASYQSLVTVANSGYNFQYTADNTRLCQQVKNLRFTSYQKGISQLTRYYRSIIGKIDKQTILKDLYYHQSKIRLIKT